MSVPAAARAVLVAMLAALVLNLLSGLGHRDAPRSTTPTTAAATTSPTPAPATLPDGTRTLLPGHRLVALYGHPGSPVLGVLGEQDIAASMVRAKRQAAAYAPFFVEPVMATIEIIATIAHNDTRAQSLVTPVDELRPWVEAAQAAGVYVILDLQPGRTSFLSQAKVYADLLAEPNVGLALDPEWRLLPSQRHLAQIGHVDVAEVNAVSQWLDAFTADRRLPQKAFVLHQFTASMITGREALLPRAHLATVLHVDGQGTQGQKRDTWLRLQHDAPPGVFWGWKNFIDEDHPMLTVEQTARVLPTPQLITYQ